ncbi:hypothetical protein [Pelosinus sp. UFO1]|uniref:hypothetical protein n=1 Tax=Pelosinus sp. UFO1 TaxID=484770 RepID=UPI0004D125EB|nr:hypothetical protein [Pelosinus sp. UFO1]AIF51254.1 hypothetical protein UFO1_1703 [Pelosinus sp. UFO1]
MNIPIMMSELIKAVQQATVHLQLETKNKTCRAPQVVEGYLPPKNPKDPQGIEDFPYVIARYLSDESQSEGSMAQVKLICGIYSEDDQQGWRDLVNAMDAIKTHLLSKRFFGGCFEIELPLKRVIPEEQGAPEWVGWLTLNISTPNILEVTEDVRRILEGTK